jgi:nitrite reductase/ring-hydroxylating ferredoxin subunit
MDRREFLGKAFGLTVVSAVTPAMLTCACEAAAKELPLAFTTFTIDINQEVNGEPHPLTIIGGSFHVTSPARLLIIRIDELTFSALTSRCPHQGVIVGKYGDPNVGKITCPQHGSQFDKFGKLLKGPAPIGLTRYTAVFDGDHTVTISDTQMDVEFEALRSTVIKNIYPNPFADKKLLSR